MLTLRNRTLSWTRPLLMGVVNVNPDSFSDPGPRTLDMVVDKAAALVADGATMVDVGAQSAITNRPPMDPAHEADLVAPAVERIRQACPGAVVSVDTYKPEVARAALAAGADLVNDVSGLADPALARLCAADGAGLVVMHTSAPPLTRLQDPRRYPGGVAAEVAAFLQDRMEEAVAAGVAAESIVLDPGVDFTKTPGQSVALLRGIGEVAALGRPLLLALSRKDFVGALTGRPPSRRDPGTLGAVAAVSDVPALILRVHDVAGVRDFLLVREAIEGPGERDPSLLLPEHLRHER
ncbi:MAG: dihydropteroate synthase [Acidimicrobiia bacterium]